MSRSSLAPVAALLLIGGLGFAAACKHTKSTASIPEGAQVNTTPSQWDAIERAAISADDFELVSVPSDGLEKIMVPGSSAQGLPPNLHGIWWMDGNRLAPGNVMTFGSIIWDLPNRRALVQEYGAGAYSFNDDASGRKSFDEAVRDKIAFEVQFNDTFTSARLIQVMQIPKTRMTIRVPYALVDYTMDQIADGDWLRRSKWGGISLPDYHLRRVIDGKGQRVEPAYSNFLKAAPKFSLVPVKKSK